MKYVILADSKSGSSFNTPRQLTIIKGERLLDRTVRLLRENGVNDILITSHDERFEVEGATRYEPKYNDYDSINKTGYWLSAFPIELLKEPICFVWGDVYFSEEAIKIITETPTESTLFFCTYKNEDERYIKRHDEPLAYKVIDCELFKKHINIVKKMYDNGETVRHPIVWELYRSINGQDVNEHKMTINYIAINDESCDIDGVRDIINLTMKLGGNNMVKVETTVEFTLLEFRKLKNLERKDPTKKEEGRLYEGDTFECTPEMANYLMGNNDKKRTVVKLVEVIPEEKKEEPVAETKIEYNETIPKTTYKRSKRTRK